MSDDSNLNCGDLEPHREEHEITSLIPEQLAAVSDLYVQFLKTYYEWMSQQGNASYIIENAVETRDIYCTTDEYLDLLFTEYGFSWLQNKETHQANIFAHLDDIYKTKGSVNSIKILFRAMAGEEVNVILPRDYTLRPSDGEWKSDYVVVARLDSGTSPLSLKGQFVTCKTFFPDEPEQSFTVEVLDVALRSPDNIYQFKLSKEHDGYFFWNSTIEFDDNKFTVLPSLGDCYQVIEPGSSFKIGNIYAVKHYERNASYQELLRAVQINPTMFQPVLDSVEHLYNPIQTTRWYLADAKKNRYVEEFVQAQHYTDGQYYEEVRRENNVFIYTARRGANEIKATQYAGGPSTFDKRVLDENTYYSALTIYLNWDAIIIEYIRYLLGEYSRYSHIIEELNTDYGFLYGDFNRDGVIDSTDLTHLIRACFNVSLTTETTSTDVLSTRDNIKDFGIIIDFRKISLPFNYYDEKSSVVKVSGVDSLGAFGPLKELDTLAYGYDFPKIGFTHIIPGSGVDLYDLYVDNHYWFKDTFYTDDFIARESGILGYCALPASKGSFSWTGFSGFLNDMIKLHDGFYYQDFSYVVRSSQSPEDALSWLNETVHPAAFKAFVEQVINESLTIDMDPPHLTLTSNILTRIGLVIRPIYKPGYEEAGYSELIPVEGKFYASDREKFFNPVGFEYASLAEDLLGLLDWGTITITATIRTTTHMPGDVWYMYYS